MSLSKFASRLRLEALEDRQLLAFTVTDLGSFGGSKSTAFGINEAGHVVGKADIPNGNQHAFYWNQAADPQLLDLGTFGGNQASAFAINESGVIAGFGQKVEPTKQDAALWAPPSYSPPQSLGTFGGPKSLAFALNDNGVAAGQSQYNTTPFTTHAFVFQNGTMTDLGTLGTGTFSSAQGINNSGKIVGFASPAGTAPQHAFVYQNGTMTDLGTMGGTESKAYAINDVGHIAGSSLLANGALRPFLYVRNQFKDLGSLGGLQGEAFAINELTQIVGRSYTAEGVDHAFLWKGGYMFDLNTLFPGSGWVFKEGRGINNKGQIVGVGTSPNLEEHAFLITPDGRAGLGAGQRAIAAAIAAQSNAPDKATPAPTVSPRLVSPNLPALGTETSTTTNSRVESQAEFRPQTGRSSSPAANTLRLDLGVFHDPLT